jgi:hypothetical protein
MGGCCSRFGTDPHRRRLWNITYATMSRRNNHYPSVGGLSQLIMKYHTLVKINSLKNMHRCTKVSFHRRQENTQTHIAAIVQTSLIFFCCQKRKGIHIAADEIYFNFCNTILIYQILSENTLQHFVENNNEIPEIDQDSTKTRSYMISSKIQQSPIEKIQTQQQYYPREHTSN